MGQSATLFCLNKATFGQLHSNPGSFKYYKAALASETFEKTFEGLRFVLSKIYPEAADLFIHLFEPSTFVGEEIDYEQIDWANLSAGDEIEGTAVYYHAPDTVQELARLIVAIEDKEFSQSFDAEELNRKGIYPGGVWNYKTGSNQGFNESDLLNEFRKLQKFMVLTAEGEHYCICSVG